VRLRATSVNVVTCQAATTRVHATRTLLLVSFSVVIVHGLLDGCYTEDFILVLLKAILYDVVLS